MAKGDCTVQMINGDTNEQVGTLTIKNGKHVDLGNNTRISCKDGNATAGPTVPPKSDVGKDPVLVTEPEGLRLARKDRKG